MLGAGALFSASIMTAASPPLASPPSAPPPWRRAPAPSASASPGAPPAARKCSAADREAQRGRISFGESQCPSSSFLNVIYETAVGCGRDALIVNVGANKGYVVAEVLAIFAPYAHVGPLRLGEAIARSGLQFNEKTGCGICDDCRSNPAASSAASCPGLPARVVVHAFEPVPDNVNIIRTQLEPMLAHVEDVSFTLHAVAVVRDATTVASVPFSNCRGGGEGCSIQSAANADTVDVPTASLDLWARRELNAAVIDLLLIDAEGFDPEVMRGADMLLRSGRVRILQFEYHGVNHWGSESLEDMVATLDARHFSCFLIGRERSAVLLTGCFEPATMEKKTWSNVLCVLRSERITLEALMKMTALGAL